MAIRVDSLTPRERRAARAFSEIMIQVHKEFGRYGRLCDWHTLIEVGLMEMGLAEGPWPESASLEQIQRLERVNGWGGPGFNMVYTEPQAPWTVRLTPRGQAALERIAGVMIEWEEEDATSSG